LQISCRECGRDGADHPAIIHENTGAYVSV
jgi:hypothetical protein